MKTNTIICVFTAALRVVAALYTRKRISGCAILAAFHMMRDHAIAYSAHAEKYTHLLLKLAAAIHGRTQPFDAHTYMHECIHANIKYTALLLS